MAFPGVVRVGIPFPLHKVLEIMISPETTMINDGLDFKFFFSVDDVWGWPREVVAVLGGFPEWRQEAGAKYVMDGPGRR